MPTSPIGSKSIFQRLHKINPRYAVAIAGSVLGIVLIAVTLPQLLAFLIHGNTSDPPAGGIPTNASASPGIEEPFSGVLGSLFRPDESPGTGATPGPTGAATTAPGNPGRNAGSAGGSPGPPTSHTSPTSFDAPPGSTPTAGTAPTSGTATLPTASPTSPPTTSPTTPPPGPPTPTPTNPPTPIPTAPPTPTPTNPPTPTPEPPPTDPPPPTPTPPSGNCSDGEDNDDDLLVDVLDPGCVLFGDEFAA